MMLGLCLVILGLTAVGGAAVGLPAVLEPPAKVAGGGTQGDERDGDILPSVAYDPVTRRYLVVWATPRHAGGEGDGLDVYGTFLDLEGRPIDSEFRISDRNTVARIGGPAVVNAGPGRFLVLWTQRRPCRLAAQIVTNRGARPDVLLLSDSLPLHSVDVVYVPTSNRFVMTYVRGDDYQTPRIFGASTADCGNQPESTSRIEAARFAWINNAPVFTERVNVTTDHGAFRPRLARHAATGKILIAWEDRRDAIEQPYRFDVYSQILSDGLAPLGGSFVLQSGSYYFNDDESATWTPRPVVAAGKSGFLAAWFDHEVTPGGHKWMANAAQISDTGTRKPSFLIAETEFVEPHPESAPTGSLAVAWNPASEDYLIAMSLFRETIVGYRSSALIQRVGQSGELLHLDGTVMGEAETGFSIDDELDNQLYIAAAANPWVTTGRSDFLLLYSKRAPAGGSRYPDIWAARLGLPASRGSYSFLPFTKR
ncbi:MAG: hypothetical protein KA170_00975 [Candidatus Promineofilum sp.]|nr:hypothetical protein [Promineifilum sp.]